MVSVVPRKMKEAVAEVDKGVQATVNELEFGKQIDTFVLIFGQEDFEAHWVDSSINS